MTDKTRHIDELGDTAVSEAYSAAATETPPADLDKRILAEARSVVAADTPRRWPAFRPLAWAAVVGLSLVIVMDIAMVPDAPETDYVTDDAEAGTAQSAEAGTVDAAQPAVVSPAEKRERENQLNAMSAPAAGADVVSITDGARARLDESALEEAARPARQLPTEARSFAALDALAGGEETCAAEQRGDPELWRSCIIELRDAARFDDARSEYGRYLLAFPDSRKINLDVSGSRD